MQLRPRQEEFVKKSVDALMANKNTIAVAPTGAGKTVMMAGAANVLMKEHGVKCGAVLQHRDELVDQNRRTFFRYNNKIATDLFTADRKRWARSGWTFTMAQTLAREDNLATMPALDALFIDEAHHSAAPSYLRILDAVRKTNKDALIFGVTATPNRGDKKALRGVFTNCADQITIQELIAGGFLVRPRTFVIDIGVTDQLRNVRKLASDFDMAQVEAIMDKEVLNDRVVEEWAKVASDRQTVAFCSTIAHASHVAGAFEAANRRVGVIHGKMSDGDRKRVLSQYDAGEIQILVNVGVLTEGWDHQPTSCVLLLRPSSWKSTILQMIGRGLRKVDPERYPGVVKDDCIVIDFGTSLLTHFKGGFEDDVNLDAAGTKSCPECDATVPRQTSECPICAYEFPKEAAPTKQCEECGHENGLTALTCKACGAPFPEPDLERGVIEKFVLTEVDLLQKSPFQWEDFFDGVVKIASAFNSWAMIVHYYGRWHAIGGAEGVGVRALGATEDRLLALASADDFLRENTDGDEAHKTRSWLSSPATPTQCKILGIEPMSAFGMTRYRAACSITWKFSERAVRRKLESTARPIAA